MRYFIAMDGEYVLGIGTGNGGNEISEKEYNEIMKVIHAGHKSNQRMICKDGKYIYIDVDGWNDSPEYPDPGKGSLSDDEAWKIIESSNISKENKQLLKDYIYKEAK